jgi:hypothetical protein
MKKGTCNLCDSQKELAESHIIPKFVFKWMKETGGKYFRTPLNPNKRIQDGVKKYLLCYGCEQSFSKNEKWFSEYIFYPHLNTHKKFIKYDENLGRFIISVLWRYLLLCKKDGEFFQEEVFNDWKSFLQNNTQLKYDKIHLMLLPDNSGIKEQPNNFVNRYFNRVVDVNNIEIGSAKIIYAKFSRFIVFAEVNGSDNYFRGTKISLQGGRIPYAQFIANKYISSYFINRAEQIYNLSVSRISEQEQVKINNEVLKNQEKFWCSDLGMTVNDDFNSIIKSFKFNGKLSYVCDCCLKTMEEPEGYLLRTYETIQSEEYWRFVFDQNGLGINKEDLEKRIAYFKEITIQNSPWVICDDCISKFNVNREYNKNLMKEWISKDGFFSPPDSDDFRKYLPNEVFDKIAIIIVSVQ